MKSNIKDLIKTIDLNRRNFIKLALGGTAGIHLSPLPWKLTDDIAIWTQNWPWVPVPPVGEFTHVKSVCSLCPGGCGIEVRKVDNRAVKIEGRTDYPVNPGGICPLGAGGLQLLYNENIRHIGPMKRVPPKDIGLYAYPTWEKALQELADRIKDLRNQKRPEALAVIDGSRPGSTMSLLIQRLLKAVGSPNYFRISTVEDTYSLVNRLMAGSEGPMAYDLENADFVLSFGCGLIEGWGAPGRMIDAWGLWHSAPLKGKVKVVQVESRASNTASKAEQWLAPLPGTEAALALGLAHVIIRDGLFDKTFVQNHTFGFADWTGDDGVAHQGFKTLVLQKSSLGSVSKITGLDEKVIVSLAKGFAGAKAPIALCGRGKGAMNGSLFEFMAIHSLNALVGNINKRGGVLLQDPLPQDSWLDTDPDPIAREGLKKARLDGAGSSRFPFSRSLLNNLVETLGKSDSSPVDTLLIFSSNPAHDLPDGGAFRNALKKVPYVVSFSPYRDETSQMSDLVLPDHNYLEKMDDVVWPTGLQYPMYGLSQPVVDPLYNTRQSGEVLIQLAGLIGEKIDSAFPWATYEECLAARAKELYESGGGMTGYSESTPVWKVMAASGNVKPDYGSFEEMWKKLKSGGMWYRPKHSFGIRESHFKTPTGKFEFYSTKIATALKEFAGASAGNSALKEMGISVEGDEAMMPHYEPPSPVGSREDYPLILMPIELLNPSSGWSPNPPYLNKALLDNQLRKNESFAEINPETASGLGLKQGDRIHVESPIGELKVRVDLFEGAMPGIVYLPLGFGHTAYDVFQRDKGANPNDIITGGRDPLSGHPIWWNTRVRIKKV